MGSKVEDGANVCTDENKAYNNLANHNAVNHSAGEYVRYVVHINDMKLFWALLKHGHYDYTIRCRWSTLPIRE